MLSKIAAFPVVWALFGIGHFSSKMLYLVDNELWAYFWWPLYNGPMLMSDKLQEKVGGDGELWPWH